MPLQAESELGDGERASRGAAAWSVCVCGGGAEKWGAASRRNPGLDQGLGAGGKESRPVHFEKAGSV